MVLELRAESGGGRGAVAQVDRQLGINPETLRNWMNQAEVDSRERPGTATEDQKKIAELERENRDLRRAKNPAHSPARTTESLTA